MASKQNSFAKLLINAFKELSEEQKEDKIKQESKSESESDSNSNDELSNLSDFVVSLLRFAPKQRMLISELVLKITDTFNKSIKQISGLKSRDFFNKMMKDKIIKIKEQKNENGALSFAHLMTQKNKKKKVEHRQNPYYKETKIEQTNEWKWGSSNDSNQSISRKEAIDSVRSKILSLFLNGKRSKIMLSAISSYCYKSVGIEWKEIMDQKPKEFVNDMVNDGLVILNKETMHPFIELNPQYIANENENEESLRNLIVTQLKKSNSKVFISTISGIALNHFENEWHAVMKCTMNEFVANMVNEKIVTIKGAKNEQYIVLYQENKNKKKRKLQKNDNEKKQKRKKHKKNIEKIVLPAIKLKGSNGMEMAQQMVERFKNLENRHDVHFHFEFDK